MKAAGLFFVVSSGSQPTAPSVRLVRAAAGGLFGVAICLGLGACGPGGSADEQGEQDDELGTADDELGTADDAADADDTDEGGSDDGDDSSDGGIIPQTDMAAAVPCDHYAQDCPEGEKCVPYSSSGGGFDDLRCVPVLGDQAPGELCEYDSIFSANDDCDATSYCWYVEDHVGECVALCLGSPDDPECPPGSNCKVTAEDVLALCIPSCDPLAQDCGEGMGCYWAGGTFECVETAEAKPLGEPCNFINSCAPGSSCVSAESLPECDGWSCCTLFCDLAQGDGACEQAILGTVCVAFFDDPLDPDDIDVGQCLLAP